MREDQQRPVHLHNHQRNKLFITTKLFTYTTVYVIIVLLSYTLGYLSHSSPPAPLPPLPPPPSVFQLASLPTQLDNFRVAPHCSNSPLPPHLVFPTILQRVFKGWGSNGDVFEHLIKRVKPKLIVEVGTFLGASALHMVNVTRKLGLQTQILCLDDFRGWPGFRDRFKYINDINGDVMLLQQFMQNVVYFNATGSVLPVPFSTRSGLEKLCEWGIMADLLEIDAGHDFISAWGDINGAYRILKPGGVIFGHDYFTAADNHGVRRAVNLFAQMNHLNIRTDGQHWVIDTALVRNF
ncbi:hypothetical protein E1A91_A12G124900v1 [Gossypium mustelinum]|uniref:Uncharacterized protein n=2 Tax=Gossypium TaxID=3633 RepID=A0A5J5TD83_GOSBA|nr:hypothetical protein ES319_A12G123100v1 [Gossypium barbadense]TYJ04885.1 hypothetical protein E1A91_A12G124900v1 [Gossypium mustelinum]